MQVGVTGANGFIGSHLIEALVKNGHTVRILVRKTSNLIHLNGLSYSTVCGDLHDESSLDTFVANLDAIIHCAALTVGSRSALYNANVKGTAHLLAAIRSVNPHLSRFVYISSQEVAGPNGDRSSVRTESDPLQPLTNYGLSKLQGEEVVRAASTWLPWTILRPSPVYGPRDKDTFIFFQAAATRVKPVAFFPGRFSLVYVGNLVDSIIRSLTVSAAISKIYFIADSPILTWYSLTRTLESLVGRRRIVLPLGKPLLFAITSVSTAWSFVTRTRSILNRQKYLMLVAPNLAISAENAHRDLGLFEQTPQREAMRITLEWYKKANWV